MKRGWIGAVVLLAASCHAAPVSAALYYGFQVGISNAPSAPLVRAPKKPQCVLANDAMVYVCEDAAVRVDGDVFKYGQYWFVYTRGYWYRARECRGPYAVMDVRKIPRAILGVPRAKWKHHPLGGPPGLAKQPGTKKAQPASPGQLKKERVAAANVEEMRKGHGRGKGR